MIRTDFIGGLRFEFWKSYNSVNPDSDKNDVSDSEEHGLDGCTRIFADFS